MTKKLAGFDTNVIQLHGCRVEWIKKSGNWKVREIPSTDFTINTDLVIIAMGYLHASERLLQMDAGRRLASGRLSELFGPATLEVDTFFRTVGMHRTAREVVRRMDAELRSLLQTYADGFNRYVEIHTLPVSYRVPGNSFEFAPWEPLDSAVIAVYMSWLLSQNWERELVTRGKGSLFPGAVGALDALAAGGHRLAVATNAGTGYMNHILDYFAIRDRFQSARCAGAEGTSDKSELLDMILDELSASPGESVMVGDRLSDVLAARRSGTMAIGCTWGFASRGELEQADRVIDTFEELPRAVGELP